MRFLRARRLLSELLDAYPTAILAYEEVRRHLGVDAAHVYGGLVAIIVSECEARTPPVPYTGIPVGTVKKHATGSGSASKQAMLLAAERILGRTPETDDEADAIHIARAAGHRF